MALLTELTLSDARELARAFGLELSSLEPLQAGSVNSNFRCSTSAGQQYFARIYEEQGMEGARAEHRLVECLAEAGVPVIRGLRSAQGEPVIEFSGKPFSIFPWQHGEILCQKRVTARACEELGAALARVHLASARAGRVGEGRFRPSDLRLRLAAVPSSERGPFASAIELIEQRLARYEGLRSSSIPQGVIHSDLFRDNVLWEGQRIAALLDFESACFGSFAYDVMVTILAWCFSDRFELDLVGGLCRGYRGVRPFEAEELTALRVEGGIACLRFATTRITDFSLRAPPGQPPVRDFRRFLARLEALEAGVLDGCFASLRS